VIDPELPSPSQPFSFLEIWWSFFCCYPSIGAAGRARAERIKVDLKTLRFIENIGTLLIILITVYVADSNRFDFWREYGFDFHGYSWELGKKEWAAMLVIMFIVHGWVATPLQAAACRFAEWVNG
jgi:hypothetical protein